MNRWIANWAIRARVLFTSVVPLVIVTVVVGYYMTVARLSDAEHALEQRGQALVNHLAPMCEFGLLSGSRGSLDSVTARASTERDVHTVTVSDPAGRILAWAGVAPVVRGAEGSSDLTARKELRVFSAPVYTTGVAVVDFPVPDLIDGTQELPVAPRLLGVVELSLSTDSLIARQRIIIRNSVLLVVAGILVSMLLAVFIARTLTEPMSRIADGVRQLYDGRFDARIRVGGGGEVGALAHGVNTLAERIERARGELEHQVADATRELRETVRDLEQKNEALEDARRTALQASQAKADFLANMSHEIRTPLSAAIGFTRLLQKTRQSREQQEYTRTIDQAASQLLVVIDDILNLSRLEAGSFELERAPLDLQQCMENVVSMLRESAYDKNLELVLLMHSDVPTRLVGDANRISQVVTNLVNNAIKFTYQGHVVVEVSLLGRGTDGRMVRVAVSDTGVGMTEDESERVFGAFAQADASTSRRFGGSGLGLSISKQLVALMGGEIGVKSTPGGGSTFWFTLPPATATAIQEPAAAPLENVRVLIYDSNAFVRRALRNRLFVWGATVFNVGELDKLAGMLAAERAAGRHFDLVLLGVSADDIAHQRVPGMIETVGTQADSPILVLAGSDTLQVPETMRLSDRVQILTKPPRSEALLRGVRELLGLSEIAAEAESPPLPLTVLPAGLSMLVVEDDPFNRELLRRLLQQMGVSVTVAEDGLEAAASASDTAFDLIFMDIHMPVMGGVLATQTIRRGADRATPIIALTADVFSDEDEQLRAFGFNDCLLKPISEQKIANSVRKWLGEKIGMMEEATPASTAAACRTGGATGAVAGEPENDSRQPAAGSVPDELLPMLLAELPQHIEQLRHALSAGDIEQLRAHAHRLHGVAGYFDLHDLSAATRALQEAIGSRALPEIQTRLTDVEAMVGEIQRECHASST